MVTVAHKPYKRNDTLMSLTKRHSQINHLDQRGSDHPSFVWMHETLHEELHRASASLHADDWTIGMATKVDAHHMMSDKSDAITTKNEEPDSPRSKPYTTCLSADQTGQDYIFTKSKCSGVANLEKGFGPKKSKPYPVFSEKIEGIDYCKEFSRVPAQWMLQQINKGKLRIYFPRLFWPTAPQQDFVEVIFEMVTAYCIYGRTCFRQALEMTIQRSALPWDCLSAANMENDLDVLAALSDRFPFLSNASFN